jgi:hypothetical protein
MMVLDHVGDQEAMVYAQLGQQPLVRTTATSLEPRRGTLSCLSARPPDLAFWTGTRPQVVSMFLSIVPFLYSKRTAVTRSLVSLIESERFVAISSAPAVELLYPFIDCSWAFVAFYAHFARPHSTTRPNDMHTTFSSPQTGTTCSTP